MTEGLLKRWTTALRSRTYKQGTGKLRTHSGFCCLGVLVDIVDRSLWKQDSISETWRWGGDTSFLPGAVAIELGLPNYIQQEVAKMNDSGCSFENIARYLEHRLGELKDEAFTEKDFERVREAMPPAPASVIDANILITMRAIEKKEAEKELEKELVMV